MSGKDHRAVAVRVRRQLTDLLDIPQSFGFGDWIFECWRLGEWFTKL
jgi:hypothetical protein